MGGEEPHEIQQRDVQSPAPWGELPHAPVHAGSQPAEERLCRKGPGGPGGHQIECEGAIVPLWQRRPTELRLT